MNIPMPIEEQVVVLRNYLRTLSADMNRAVRDEYAAYRKRRVSPFVQRLRSQRYSNAAELHACARECLQQLRDAHALLLSDWFPGDQIAVEVVMRGMPRDRRRFVITAVGCGASSVRYDVWQVTKKGDFFQRGVTSIFLSRYIEVSGCDEPLSKDVLDYCSHFRTRAQQFLENARDRGNLDEVLKNIRERRAKGLF